MEYNSQESQYNDDASIPEVSIFQASRDHYGVFYRLDIIGSMPQLRVMVPVEHGPVKMEMENRAAHMKYQSPTPNPQPLP